MRTVLHITGWYPNQLAPNEAPFIARHVRSLDPHVRNMVWHIDVRPGDGWRFLRKGPRADRTYLLSTPLRRWFVIEWMATALILWAWFTRDRAISVDLINFHIAYPNCTRIGLLRSIIRRPMVITEHYSAYRIGYRTRTKGADRIKRIFRSGVPLIVVSRALQGDIERFAESRNASVHVVDNAVDIGTYHHDATVRPEPGRFFTIAGWRSPKRPDLLLEALARLRADGFDARLRMAGSGPDLPSIRKRISTLGLTAYVDLLGHLDERSVADEMRHAHALLHASDYETYSAVCAESLCCGTPVIASSVGGIPEFLTPQLGVLVPYNTVEEWVERWKAAWEPTLLRDRSAIADAMALRAGAGVVGTRYHGILLAVCEAYNSKH